MRTKEFVDYLLAVVVIAVAAMLVLNPGYGAVVLAAFVLLAIVALFMLPAIVAVHRRHPNAMAIAALNILLGLTGLGWAAALVWSLTAIQPRAR